MGSRRAIAALDAAGIDYRIIRRERAGSVVEAARLHGLDLTRMLKTLVVRRGDDDFVLVLVPGNRQISWPKLRSLLGVSRLSMPNAQVAFEVTGYERGTITPFGATHPWPVVVDVRAIDPGEEGDPVPGDGPDEGPDEPDEHPGVSIGAGEHGTAAMIDAHDLIRVLGATVADVTSPLD